MTIHQNDDFGTGGNEAIRNLFSNNGLSVAQTIVFDLTTLSIRGNLKEVLLSSPSRIVILWVFEEHTPVILKQAVNDDVVGPRFTWILRSNISLDYFNETSSDQLTGLLVMESTSSRVVNAPYNISLLQAASTIWQEYEPETYPFSTTIHDYALFCFDAT